MPFLRLQPRLRALEEAFTEIPEKHGVVFRTVFQDAFPCFEHQVETGEIGVFRFQLVDHAQRLQIVLEAAVVAHAGIQRVLPGVSERCVAQVVCKTDGLGERLVELQGDSHRTADLGNLERVRQARAIQVALVIDEHLGLVDEPPECGGVDDTVPVALVLPPVPCLRLGVTPALRPRLRCGIGREWRRVHQTAAASTASSRAVS